MGSKLKMASPVDFSTKKIFKVKVCQLLVKKLLLNLKVAMVMKRKSLLRNYY
jgi:hypothetical protein